MSHKHGTAFYVSSYNVNKKENIFLPEGKQLMNYNQKEILLVFVLFLFFSLKKSFKLNENVVSHNAQH